MSRTRILLLSMKNSHSVCLAERWLVPLLFYALYIHSETHNNCTSRQDLSRQSHISRFHGRHATRNGRLSVKSIVSMKFCEMFSSIFLFYLWAYFIIIRIHSNPSLSSLAQDNWTHWIQAPFTSLHICTTSSPFNLRTTTLAQHHV